jgi:apolipoprotein N-acyltransferase
VLFALSRIGLWWVLAVVVVSTDPPVTPPILFRLTLALVVLPGLAAALLRGRPATAEIDENTLVLLSDRVRLEVPCEAIAALPPSALPLPDVGLAIVLRSGRRVVPGLELDDPAPLLAALMRAGAPGEPALRHPSVVVAAARHAVGRPLYDHPLFKFGLFAALPAGILFNAHQHIAYGGFWGEWYSYGARAWLATLGTYYAVTVIYCVLYASVWRGLAEAISLVAAAVAPTRAAWVRRLVEAACRLGYFGGIPLLLVLRFLP